MFQLLKPLFEAIQPLMVPICFTAAWAIMLVTFWSMWTAVRDTAAKAHQMHQIPCSKCQFFTSNYHLKCTVHPTIALTEDAINCLDYESTQRIYQTEDMSNFQR